MAFTKMQNQAASGTDVGVIDAGLRAYMLRVYNYMASGVALTGLAAALVASNEAVMGLFFEQGQNGMELSLLGWVALLAPLGMALYLGMRLHAMSAAAVQATYWAFAAVMGVSLAPIFQIYTGESIVRVFFITSAAFAGLSLWGYTTKRDLTGFGTFLVMGLWGLIVASLVNVFLGSSALAFVTSAAGVLIFAGLTAYDTQKIKEMYSECADSESGTKTAVMGALALYLDFINLFMYLLRFLGDRR